MKKVLLALVISMCILPAVAAEVEVPKVQSVKYFTEAQDPRFKYDLPNGKNLSIFSRKDSKSLVYDDDEITLREEDIKPVKKVIKRLGDNPSNSTQNYNPSDVPMNYDSFPKYYNPNDIMQQQFMPMPTSTF